MKFLAPKGSVAMDGISLTIVESKNNFFTVSLVSYTLENTNLGKAKTGDKVNIEFDVITKYLDRLLKNRN
jgi:riboflavin synthase